MPKVNVVLDETIKGAGQVQGNTLKLNPDYAKIDTAIHEFAHILIDSIGYENKVIQKAINALKDTLFGRRCNKNIPTLVKRCWLRKY